MDLRRRHPIWWTFHASKEYLSGRLTKRTDVFIDQLKRDRLAATAIRGASTEREGQQVVSVVPVVTLFKYSPSVLPQGCHDNKLGISLNPILRSLSILVFLISACSSRLYDRVQSLSC